MNISNLNHDSLSIRCKTCGNRFEVSRRVLADPELLVDTKESIAARHTCRAERQYSIVRVFKVRQVKGFRSTGRIQCDG